MKIRHARSFSPMSSWFNPLSAVLLIWLVFGSFAIPTKAQPSCCTMRGNIDCDSGQEVDIADLSRLIDALFVSFDPLCCDSAANTDGSPDGNVDIDDLSRLIDALFISFEPLTPCAAGDMTFAQRQVLLNAIDSAYQALFGLPGDTLAHRLAAFLATRPELEASGVVDSVSILARFIDGRMISIPNNRFPGDTLPTPGQPSARRLGLSAPSEPALSQRVPISTDELAMPSGPPSLRPQVSDYELPSSTVAYLMSSLGSLCFTAGKDKVHQLLWDGGYATTPIVPTVANLRVQIKQAGVFYIDAHGGACQGRAGQNITCLWTQTEFTDANEQAFGALLDSSELVYMYANDQWAGKCIDHWRYAFTGKFVAKNFTFAKNSFVYIGACNSDRASLRNGFQTAGASVFAGWTQPVTDPATNKASEFLVDRMLGRNNSVRTPVEVPPQRPFDITLLRTDMASRNLDWDPKNGSEIIITTMQDKFELLAPSLRYVAAPANTDSFMLTGYFGSNPGSKGHVRVNGIERQIYTWEPTLITVSLPSFGPGSVGPVVVEVEPAVGTPAPTNKRISNTVNFTEWKGDFTYTHSDTGSLVGTIVIHAHLRADIHPFREMPHTAPGYYSVIFPAMDDTYGTASASGTASYTDDSDPPNTTTWTWSGSTLIDSVGSQSPYAPFMLGYVVASTHKIQLDVFAANENPLQETITYSPSGGQDENPLYFQIPTTLADQFPWKFIINMNTGWNILAGERNAKTCCSHNPLNDTGVEDVRHKLKWPTIPAIWPPDPNAAQ